MLHAFLGAPQLWPGKDTRRGFSGCKPHITPGSPPRLGVCVRHFPSVIKKKKGALLYDMPQGGYLFGMLKDGTFGAPEREPGKSDFFPSLYRSICLIEAGKLFERVIHMRPSYEVLGCVWGYRGDPIRFSISWVNNRCDLEIPIDCG